MKYVVVGKTFDNELVYWNKDKKDWYCSEEYATKFENENKIKDFTDYTKKEVAPTSFYYYFNKPNKKKETMTVEICHCQGSGARNDLPHLWLKNGYTEKLVENYLVATCYVTDEKGDCREAYNPTIKEEVVLYQGKVREVYNVINFDWHFEDTKENEQKLLNEIARRFYE